jgi:type I restriction enzyme S subunit
VNTIKLGALVSITGGGTPDRSNPNFWGGDIPWATVKDFKTLEISATQEHITEEGLKGSAANIAAAGSIIVPTRMALGKAAINTVPVAINQDLKALRVLNPKEVDRDYLFRFLLAKSTFLESRGQGATVKGITLDVLRDLDVPVPPIREQQRIASILDKADNLRSKRQQAIRLADEFLKATFIDLFGDPVTNSLGLPTQRLDSLGSLDRGVSKHRPRNDPSLLGGDYPLIQTGDVANCDGYIRTFTSTYSEKGLKQSKLWPAGTLCITIAANIAKTGILLFPACFPDSVVGFNSADRPIVEYVRFWLSFLQQTLEANAPASAQKNINLAILRELQIPVPPRERVERFAAAVDKVEAIRKAQRLAVDEGQKLNRSLEQALLNP